MKLKKKLYFMGTTFGGVLKIGVSHDPEKRLEILVRSGPFDLTMFAVFVSRSALRAETAIHNALGAHRTRGEWYVLSGPVAALAAFAQKTSRLSDVVAEAKRLGQIEWSQFPVSDRFSDGMLRYCAFCGKGHLLVEAMVTGAAANICNECVTACQSAIDGRDPGEPLHGGLPMPANDDLTPAIAVLEARQRSRG